MKIRGLVFVITMLAACYYWCVRQAPPMHALILVDDHYSAVAQDMVAAACVQNKMALSLDMVKEVTVYTLPTQQQVASVHAWHPISRINDASLLLENGTVVDAVWYAEQVQTSLPKLCVEDLNPELGPALVSCIQTAESSVWRQASVAWHTPSKVAVSLQDSNISLWCTSEQLRDASTYINQVRAIHANNNELELFDVRFDKQIIARTKSSKKGETCLT